MKNCVKPGKAPALVRFLRGGIPCVRGDHEEELKTIQLRVNGHVIGSTVAWTCKRCGSFDLDRGLEKET